jgi:hypothetical protein
LPDRQRAEQGTGANVEEHDGRFFIFVHKER